MGYFGRFPMTEKIPPMPKIYVSEPKRVRPQKKSKKQTTNPAIEIKLIIELKGE